MPDPTIHPSAPPNDLAAEDLRVRPSSPGGELDIDPRRAGWRYLSFASLLAPGVEDLRTQTDDGFLFGPDKSRAELTDTKPPPPPIPRGLTGSPSLWEQSTTTFRSA